MLTIKNLIFVFTWLAFLFIGLSMAVQIAAAGEAAEPAGPKPEQPKKRCPCEDCRCKPCRCDLGGIYHLRGEADDGSPYFGVCIIEQENDLVFLHYVSGGASTLGVGIRQGNHLAVTWRTARGASNGGVNGVTLYEIKGNALLGRWTQLPADRTRPERLQFLRKLEDD
jgi:hypothetical protein